MKWAIVCLTLAIFLLWSSHVDSSAVNVDEEQALLIQSLKSYEIVRPLRGAGSLQRRRLQRSSSSDNVAYTVEAFGEKFYLDMTTNRRLVTKGFVVREHVDGKVTTNRMNVATGCYHTGSVRGRPGSGVAVSSCCGLRGLFSTKDDDYFIEPLRKPGFQPTTGDEHLIYRRSEMLVPSPHPFDWRDDPPKDGNYAGGSSVPRSSRSRRSVSELTVETLIAADDSMVAHYGGRDQTVAYILSVMNMVSLLYKHPSLGNAINIAVVGISVLSADEVRQFNLNDAGNSNNLLRSFCQWQEYNLTAHNHDTAVFLTRNNLCNHITGGFGVKNCDNLGLADVGGMCKKSLSCSIAEDTGLNVSFTVAHEIGHSFGMWHDGMSHKCRISSEKLMAPLLRRGTQPNSWSKCSRHYLSKFLENGGGWCLENQPEYPLGNQTEAAARLELSKISRWPAKECKRRKFDSGEVCDEKNACQMLSCIDSSGQCKPTFMPLADGAYCKLTSGNEESKTGVCYMNRCMNRSEVPDLKHGNWSEWSDYRECTHTCGTGVQASVRECNNPLPQGGGLYCSGRSVRYRLCDRWPCSNSNPQENRRDKQCALFNNREGHKLLDFRFIESNRPVAWRAYHETRNISHSRICKLACYSSALRNVWHLPLAVEDGTPCYPGSHEVCVKGRCLPFGCDGVQGSGVKEDNCRVCGGNGSSCQTVAKTISLDPLIDNRKTGKHIFVAIVPKGSMNLVFRKESVLGNHLAIRNNASYYYINAALTALNISLDYTFAGTTFFYTKHEGQEEIFALGPTDRVLYLTLLAQKSQLGTNVSYKYSAPKSAKNSYGWEYEKWTLCSAKCGSIGTQERLAHCYHYSSEGASRVHRNRCQDITLEIEVRTCRIEPCGPRYSWMMSSWGPCSVTCGKGYQERDVKCLRQSTKGKRSFRILNISVCLRRNEALVAPINNRTCGMSDCPPAWNVGLWSRCTQWCGNQTRRRSVECKSERMPRPRPDAQCSSSGPKPAEEKDCPARPPCPKSKWKVREFGSCSGECGEIGTKRRYVKCMDFKNEEVDANQCSDDGPRPVEEERCPRKYCVKACDPTEEEPFCAMITQTKKMAESFCLVVKEEDCPCSCAGSVSS
eukprot:m.118685 g.118685  ORF g.118685 m.118685 type:complete len:1118 (+) comp37656_c0_seq3:1840-5193(+)